MKDYKHPFTLLELLIVLAIISILIALFLPILSKVKRKAKLTICTNTLRQNSIALIMYTKNNDQYFPDKTGRSPASPWGINHDRWNIRGPKIDYRSYYSNILKAKIDESLTCPLGATPPLDSSNAERIYVSYSFYAGTYLTDKTTGFFKLTDEPVVNGNRISVLIADRLRANSIGTKFYLSHDARGLKPVYVDNESWCLGGYNGISFNDLDRNFAFQDGHVGYYRDIAGENSTISDHRFQEIYNNPNAPTSGWQHFKDYVPFE